MANKSPCLLCRIPTRIALHEDGGQSGFTLIELMIVVATIGILAAMAVAMYGAYTAKVQASEVFVLLGGMKTDIVERMGENPAVVNCGVTAAVSGKFSSVAVPTNNAGVCTATATINNSGVNASIAGKTVEMTYTVSNNTFTYSGGSLSASFRPKAWQ